ncbi:Uncharacterized protein Adt_46155 [Abeliophyllum distichum]|uniref:Uncharacterized protein n=1 Tax=Abeliophyllum distichum TaxID=126358 RepID=A0ABD1P1Y8_9LAMI
MVTDASSNELTNQENLSPHSISVNKVPNASRGIVEETKNPIEPSASLSASVCFLEPVTPDSNPESGDQFHGLASPLTIYSSSPNVPCSNSYLNNHPNFPNEDSPRTPKENVFDPFAPGPDKLLLAPHHGKCTEESRINVVRQLNFMSTANLFRDANRDANEETILDEEFESVYGTLLEAIISEQTKELVAKALSEVSESDGFRTPTSAPRLSGVADTCPRAPVKSSSKCRVIDKELCRKLEF